MLKDMHKGMLDFVSCDLHLHHAAAQIREQIRAEEARLGVAGKDAPQMDAG